MYLQNEKEMLFMMDTVKAEIMQDILSKLNDWKSSGVSIRYMDGTEIAYTLWESENANGSITCWAQESKDWIKKHFDDLDEVVEQYQFDTGKMLNPFSSPEEFQLIITIEVTQQLIYEVWEDTMTLDELIKALKELQEQEDWAEYDRETYFS